MKAQNVSNSLYALGTLQAHSALDGQAGKALLAAVPRVASTMNAQNVSNSLYALGTLQAHTALDGQAGKALLAAVPRAASTCPATLRALRACKTEHNNPSSPSADPEL
jgi:hypothetical protein